MNNGHLDVKSIIDECMKGGLKGLKSDENGWRCQSIYAPEKTGEASLAISKDGAFQCFKTDRSGNVIKLYCDLLGKDYTIGKSELRSRGFLPKSYTEIRSKISTKSDKEKEDEEKTKADKAEALWGKLRFDHPLADVAKWRGVPVKAFERSVDLGYFGYIDSYPDLGSSYAFVCNTPPVEGLSRDIKGIMLRASIPEAHDKWRNPVNYPIWAPYWNLTATHIVLTEGQWDAIVMQHLLDEFGNAEQQNKFQVLSLSGPKNVQKYPEIMAYLRDKTVYFVPDFDQNGKGEDILAKVSVVLEQVVKEQFLMRVLKNQKDLNDWFKLGIDRDQFETWFENPDEFRVSNGFIIDSAFRMEHKLKHNSIVEVTDDGEPVEIYQGDKNSKLYLDNDYLMSMIEPFPVLHEYVDECLKAIESPILYHILSFLTYESGTAGRRFKFESGSVGCLYPNIFTLLIGPSGLGKSEAMKMLMGAAGRANKKLFTSESFSAESLIDEFKECPQKMIMTGEFSPWLKSREGSYRYWAMKNFLLMHGCEEYSSDRPYKFNFKKTGVVEIDEPYLTILSGCTTKDIQQINPEFLTDGVVGRIIYPCGVDKYSDMPYTRKIPHETILKVERLFRAFSGTPIRTNMSMRMSRAADVLYRAAFERQIRIQKEIDPTREAQTYASRWKVNVFKFCILFELLRGVHEWEEDFLRGEIRFKRSDMAISEEAITAALKLVDVLNQSFHDNLFPQFKRSDSISFSSKLQVKIIDFMKKKSRPDGTGVTRTELFRYIQEDERTVDAALGGLKQGGMVFEKERKKTRNGRASRGRPTIIYLLAEEKNVNITRIIQEPANQNHQGTNYVNGQTDLAKDDSGHSNNGHSESR